MNPLHIRLPAEFQSLGSAREFAEDIHEIFSAEPLLQVLDMIETSLLCNFMVCYSAPRDTELLVEGQRGDFMIFLLTGRAAVVQLDKAGARRRVGLVEAGAPVGHVSMISGKPRTAGCVALEPVDFVVLPKQAFHDILVTLPRLGNKLMLVMLHGLSERLHAAQRELVDAMPLATSPMPLR